MSCTQAGLNEGNGHIGWGWAASAGKESRRKAALWAQRRNEVKEVHIPVEALLMHTETAQVFQAQYTGKVTMS